MVVTDGYFLIVGGSGGNGNYRNGKSDRGKTERCKLPQTSTSKISCEQISPNLGNTDYDRYPELFKINLNYCL